MRTSNKLAALAACCAMLVASAAETRAAAEITYHWPFFRFSAPRLTSCPVHKNAFGELIDCHGWRLRNNAIGWDNGCFCLDYLPSQFACSSHNF